MILPKNCWNKFRRKGNADFYFKNQPNAPHGTDSGDGLRRAPSDSQCASPEISKISPFLYSFFEITKSPDPNPRFPSFQRQSN